MRTPTLIRFILIFTLLSFAVPRVNAYSVLTHEEIVDLAWTSNIVPLLMARFPNTTPEQLREAHAYAYGGSVIQDIGYYPFGSHYFSDLLHYVRTGDFVSALIADSTDVDEYAFALGALAHYYGDSVGHPYINEATAEEYPNLGKKFGTSVTYEEDPTAHLRTEFGFDVVQVAHSRFASDAYRNFIGFQVSQPLLQRAFEETYGIQMSFAFADEELAIGTYRRSVSKLIPKMTRVALAAYGKQMQAEDPDFNRKEFLYRVDRSEYRRTYGREYKQPNFGERFAGFLVKLVPKIGPFRALKLSLPNAQEEDIYLNSVNHTVDIYEAALRQLQPALVRKGPSFANLNLDTGHFTVSGDYVLADTSYAHLLGQVTDFNSPPESIQLHDNLMAFYSDPAAPNALKANARDWQTVQANLQLLRAQKLVPPAPTPPMAP
jgi:hypothetical protein